MGHKIKYKSLSRVESAIIEEKLDGSNFSWELDENKKLHFYSAKHELEKDKCDKFFIPFIEYIENKWNRINWKKIQLEKILLQIGNDLVETRKNIENQKSLYDILLLPNILYCAEVIGQAHIKYFNKNESIENKLYVFDIKGLNGTYYKREFLEKLTNIANLNIVPLTEFNIKKSKLNSNVLREGIILRYENISGTDDIVKLKLVERKNGKSQKITIEIKELK